MNASWKALIVSNAFLLADFTLLDRFLASLVLQKMLVYKFNFGPFLDNSGFSLKNSFIARITGDYISNR